MSEKQYLILLDVDVRKRHYHIFEEGKITKFVVQLEVKVDELWKIVVRYDSFHDFSHKDCYNINGKCRKFQIYIQYEESLTLADEDINNNWVIYRG